LRAGPRGEDDAAMTDGDWLKTAIGGSTPDAITVRGRDLAHDLMGEATFTEVAFLLVQGRMPSPGETRLLDAVLVSLAEHGLTPTVLAARLTYTGAQESLQGAVAAGLLGAGSVYLGVVEDTARLLDEVLADAAGGGGHALERAAREAVERRVARGQRVPGLGHPVHREQDPRTERLYAVAEEAGVGGQHLHALRAVSAAHAARSGRALPINGAGVAGAALADLGFSADVVRGFALLARTAGLVGHLAEEMARPLGMPLFREVDRRAAAAAEE
jgi:citrate synthase